MLKITQVITDTNIGGAGILLSSIVRGLSDEFDFEVILPKDSKLIQRLPKNVKITELDITKDKSFNFKDALTFYRYFLRVNCVPDVMLSIGDTRYKDKQDTVSALRSAQSMAGTPYQQE